jgi:hypothetical protein
MARFHASHGPGNASRGRCLSGSPARTTGAAVNLLPTRAKTEGPVWPAGITTTIGFAFRCWIRLSRMNPPPDRCQASSHLQLQVNGRPIPTLTIISGGMYKYACGGTGLASWSNK